MKLALVLSLLLALNFLPLTAIGAEEAAEGESQGPVKKEVYILVTTTDNAGKQSRSIKTADEFKEFMTDFKIEERLHDKALALAEKEWKKDEELGKKTFPRTAINKKTFKEIKRSTNQDEVTKKLDDLDKRDLDKGKENPRRNVGQQPANGGQDRSKEREAKQRAKDAARDMMGSAARQMYTTAMEELKANLNKPAAEAGAAEAQ